MPQPAAKTGRHVSKNAHKCVVYLWGGGVAIKYLENLNRNWLCSATLSYFLSIPILSRNIPIPLIKIQILCFSRFRFRLP